MSKLKECIRIKVKHFPFPLPYLTGCMFLYSSHVFSERRVVSHCTDSSPYATLPCCLSIYIYIYIYIHHTFILQARLVLLCRRAMALPIGRGMFTLASAPPKLTEALRLAPLTLKGNVSPNAATVELDLSNLPSDLLYWPDFHNGAAAALRLAPPACVGDDEGARKEDKRRILSVSSQMSHPHFDHMSKIEFTGELGRHWIVYNKPQSTRQHAHAGFLLGLGLQGHLAALANTDLYRYMSQGHDVTMMAVLIGMAAARR